MMMYPRWDPLQFFFYSESELIREDLRESVFIPVGIDPGIHAIKIIRNAHDFGHDFGHGKRTRFRPWQHTNAMVGSGE